MIILRVDIDMPYTSERNYNAGIRNGFGSDKIRQLYYTQGYYNNLKNLTDFLKDYSVKATIFLSDIWIPPKYISKHISIHDVGIHISSNNYNNIENIRSRISKLIGRDIRKFSVHDTSLSTMYRDDYIRILKNNINFNLFSDNMPLLNFNYKRFSDNYYIPEMICTRTSGVIPKDLRIDMDYLLKVSKKHDVVVCTHPCELEEGRLDGTKNTRVNLLKIFDNCDVGNFEDWIKKVS